MSLIRVAGRTLTSEDIKREIAEYGKVRTAAEIAIADSQLEMKRVGRMLLTSEDGKVMMSMLEEMYYKGVMVSPTPEGTYFNLGQREVVVFLLGLRDQAKEP